MRHLRMSLWPLGNVDQHFSPFYWQTTNLLIKIMMSRLINNDNSCSTMLNLWWLFPFLNYNSSKVQSSTPNVGNVVLTGGVCWQKDGDVSSLPLLHPTCCELTQPRHTGPSRTVVTGEMTTATQANLTWALLAINQTGFTVSAKFEVYFIDPWRGIVFFFFPPFLVSRLAADQCFWNR